MSDAQRIDAEPPNAPATLRAASPEISLRSMPGLDVLRGLAILAVLLDHGLGSDRQAFDQSPFWPVREIPHILQYGFYGVHLFFVLSGFLITGILLDTRADPDYYRNFYLRRVLRIVPAYVVMIAVLKLTGHIDRRFVLVSLLYFANMPALLRSTPEYGPFWSLSVEEQFYLAWPLIVRRCADRALTGLSLALVIVTPFLRLALLHGPAVLRDVYYKTWVVWDFFAAGALLALALRRPSLRTQLNRASLWLMALGVVTLTLFQALPVVWLPRYDSLHRAFQPEPYLLLFTGMVLYAVLHPRLATGAIARGLVFLAVISYGLYLIHMLVMDTLYAHWTIGILWPLHPIAEDLLRFLLAALVSVATAWISRFTLEKFFLGLKPPHRHSNQHRKKRKLTQNETFRRNSHANSCLPS